MAKHALAYYITSSITLSLLVGTAVGAPSNVRIDISDPRPLKAALDVLERTLGVPINYEDPRFASSEDIVDVTEQVQSAQQRAANPRIKIAVPKGGRLTLESAVISKVPALADALAIAGQLRAVHEASAFPGKFAVVQVRAMATVEPSALRASDGRWSTAAPAMKTPITIAARQATAAEALAAIAAAIAERLGVKVGVGRFPFVAFANTTINLSASEEPAGVVLVRLFEQVTASGGNAVSDPTYSYKLLYDPGVKYYLLHVNAVPRLLEAGSGDTSQQLPEGFLRSTVPPQAGARK